MVRLRSFQGRAQIAGRGEGGVPGRIQRPRLRLLSEARLSGCRSRDAGRSSSAGARKKPSTAWRSAAGRKWPIPRSTWKRRLRVSARLQAAAFRQRRQDLRARQQARRDDRALRGGIGNIVVLFRHPRRHRRARAEGNRGAHRGRRIPALQIVLRNAQPPGRARPALLAQADRGGHARAGIRRRRTGLRLLLRQCFRGRGKIGALQSRRHMRAPITPRR